MNAHIPSLHDRLTRGFQPPNAALTGRNGALFRTIFAQFFQKLHGSGPNVSTS